MPLCVKGGWQFILTGPSSAFWRSNPDPGFQIEIMQPVRSDVKMDAFTRLEMFLTFIFTYDLAKSSIAGQHGFMPHGFNNFDVPTDGNMTFWRLANIRKLHMFGPKTEMNSPTLRNMRARKPDRHTILSLKNGLSTVFADHAFGKIHCR